MASIDDELIKALIQPDQSNEIGESAPLKSILRFNKLEYDTEVDVGKNRTADILVTKIYADYKERPKIIIEVENDREFDVGQVLRKLQKDRQYPIIVIIPKEFEDHAFRFQKSGIPVWFWTATCNWICRFCNKTTATTSSLTPFRCAQCGKGGNTLRWIGVDKVQFEEARNNPSIRDETGGPHVGFARRP